MSSLKKMIQDILKDSDLGWTSAEKVRLQLQENLDVDLTGQKKEVFKLFLEVINEQTQVDCEASPEVKGEADDEAPPKKKRKDTGDVCKQEEFKILLEVENDAKERKPKDLAAKHMLLVNQLKERIECPVCMEIPRAGPVPVCPKGHFVCSSCKTQSCPTCRTAMGGGTSLLAVTVIENIEHKCKFDDCEEILSVDDLNDHEKECRHRTVCCPYNDCKGKVGLSKLIDHLVQNCSYDSAPRLMGASSSTVSFRESGIEKNKPLSGWIWKLYIFGFEDVCFGIFPFKHKGIYYFSCVMLASQSECAKYKIEMTVHEFGSTAENSGTKFKFFGEPSSIDEEDEKLKYQGLTVNSEGMKKIMKDARFSVSFLVEKK